MKWFAIVCLAWISWATAAEPWIEPGDVALRHDLQLLADYGLIREPSQTWPRSWAEVARAVLNVDDRTALPPLIQASFARVRSAAQSAMRSDADRVALTAAFELARSPTPLRTFDDVPREAAGAGVSASYSTTRYAFRLQANGVADPQDGKRARFDGSYAAAILGNWVVSAGLQQRWWGPAHEGSTILSNNARPIPAITIERHHADPFEHPWLAWIGPWRLNVVYGRLEGNRDVPHANYIGIRASARPWEALELGFNRASQWCGKDRPCGADVIVDVLTGRKESRIDSTDNPSNQLASFDVRWRLPRSWLPLALYGSLLGEDSISPNGLPDIKDYLPSRMLVQVGAETWGQIGDGSYRVHAEYTDTVCRYSVPNPDFGCAYAHNIYTSGYRYRDRAIGHSMDGDGRMISLGGVYVDGSGSPWSLLLRSVELNKGSQQPAHSITLLPRDLLNLEISHSRALSIGELEVGAGYDHIQKGDANDKIRGYLRWKIDL